MFWRGTKSERDREIGPIKHESRFNYQYEKQYIWKLSHNIDIPSWKKMRINFFFSTDNAILTQPRDLNFVFKNFFFVKWKND